MSDSSDELPYWELIPTKRIPDPIDEPIDNPSMDSDEAMIDSDEIPMYSDEERDIHEIPYGELKPTGYQSDLDDVDWSRKYLHYTWNRQYQQDICDEIDNRMTVLIGLGRDHGKTWIMMGKFTRYIIEHAPKRCIVIASQAKYREIYEFVESALELPSIRQAYGDLKRSSSISNGIWFVDGYRPKVGANFLIKGSESFITGLHFEGTEDDDYYEEPLAWTTNLDDIDLVQYTKQQVIDEIGWFHLEDMVQEMRVGEAAEKRIRRWLKRTVNYIRNHRVKTTVNFTRKDPGDIYQMMIDDFRWPVFIILALEILEGRLPTEDEVTADHERGLLLNWPQSVGTFKTCKCPNWPLPRLLYHFVFRRTEAEAELNNNPVDPTGSEFDGAEWDKALIHPDEVKGGVDSLVSWTFIDPSFGKGGSKTAILQIAGYYRHLMIIDAFVGHLGPTAFIEKVFEFKDMHDSQEVWIEDNAAQESRSLNAWNPMTNMSELRLFSTPPTQSKRLRLGMTGGQFKARVWKILTTIPFLGDIQNEYLTFNSDLTDAEIKQKFNALDTMQMAYSKKKRSLSTKRSPKRMATEVRTATSDSRRIFG